MSRFLPFPPNASRFVLALCLMLPLLVSGCDTVGTTDGDDGDTGGDKRAVVTSPDIRHA